MNPSYIFVPIAAMMLLVTVVTVLMLRERVQEMKARRISLKKVATSSQMAGVLENTQAADNYSNLAEMPVFFYVLCVALYATQSVTQGWCLAAWAYVALRVLHSFIHIGYNQVMHRFYVFFASFALLFGMWAVFIWDLLAK